MKKIIYKFFLISLFTCVCFFGIDKVYAINDGSSTWFVTDTVLTANGTSINTNYFKNLAAGKVTFNFTGNLAAADGNNQYMPSFINERISICADTFLASGSTGTNSYDTNFYQTSIPCKYTGSNYTGGHITFITNKIIAQVLDTERVSLNHSFSTTAQQGFSIQVMAFEYSTLPFPMYSTEDTMIKQNDTIISRLDTIANSNNQLIYKAQEQNEKLDKQNKLIQDTNDTIKNSDTSEASGEADSFFSGFTTNTHGLTSIITAPLTLIGNITSSTCSPLALEVPFLDGQTLNLPCMSSIYKKHFGSFLTIYQIFTFGIVAYWVCVKIFNLVKDFKNPDHDEVEVMDL